MAASVNEMPPNSDYVNPMSVKDIIASVTSDVDVIDNLSTILAEVGVVNLRLLESMASSNQLSKEVITKFGIIPEVSPKKVIAGVLLTAAANEARAQLQIAVAEKKSEASDSSRRVTAIRDRTGFSAAVAAVRLKYGSIPFVPSKKLLEQLLRGGLHSFVDFDASHLSNRSDRQMAITHEGDPIMIRSASVSQKPIESVSQNL
ncbi:hypothetical protein Pmar_PMAR009095 [Perkinsus marinus ATCC 50983]|uniref:Uncharacterized protein n=1 Tax=Perkinsus marinus (strain ATCC 50983 / TXsc) TaxID=423536 RepID=C5M0G0_PERM5|nr:hypothetical protein Pmar_PMAR009095 [Perkinsus marinus ATCC 50983]EEQ97532.1 hypothetical protein Pmar_PMAR009095 [Perkinsus marinus ATCC 50983]|eukprot:XP_002764815.1 hypothetical protein Pmar_PMAR009095 [Perkinsus marinus ATCC 50983]